MLGHLACALPRQSGVVAVDLLQPRRQWPIVGVPDQVQAHVDAVLHATENVGERFDGIARDLRYARLEVDRGHEAAELDGLERVLERLAGPDGIAQLGVELVGVLHPSSQWNIVGEMPFDCLADRHFVDVVSQRGHPGQRQA